MKIKIFFLLSIAWQFIFAQNFPYKISRVDDNAGSYANSHCESRVNVKDERPSDCVFGGDYYMYPVYVEDFNYKEDLPNNWRFNNGTNNDAWEGDKLGFSWMADPYNNGNIYTNGGIGYFETKKEYNFGVPKPGFAATGFDFTGALLNSIFGLRQGVFEARIQFPGDVNFFPAFWLEGKTYDQEIDIVEFYDSNIAGKPCENYHQMKMTLHNRSYLGNNKDCSRGRKFPVPSNYFSDFHTYKCVWTDYRVDIYLDNTLVGYATKYYDGPYAVTSFCEKNGTSGIPAYTRDCNYMSNSNECSVGANWPNYPDFWHSHFECIKYHTVDKDESFPKTSNPMTVILDAIINYKNKNYGTNLSNSWSNMTIENKRMAVDWIKIYQPVNCGAFRNPYNLTDVKNLTGSSNFLGGYKVQIGNGPNSASFQNTMANYYAGQEFPIHFLASEEIEINSEAIFEEGTFFRAEIIDCSNGFNQFQRTLNNGEKLFLTPEEIAEIEKHQLDSMLIANPSLRDSINTYYEKDKEPVNDLKVSSNDNGAITIFPNPSNGLVFIDMNEEDFNDLIRIELINNLGQKVIYSKTHQINLQNYISGIYYLKFVFTHGFIVDKKITKE